MSARNKAGRVSFDTLNFVMAVCRNPFRESPHFNKFLTVNEVGKRGWYIPAGAVEKNEDFRIAAMRECREEAGIDIELKGILQINHTFAYAYEDNHKTRMSVIFYAEPTSIDMAHALKAEEDEQSLGAKWVTLDEIRQLKANKLLRFDEPL